MQLDTFVSNLPQKWETQHISFGPANLKEDVTVSTAFDDQDNKVVIRAFWQEGGFTAATIVRVRPGGHSHEELRLLSRVESFIKKI